jgi:hypothetical protein
MCVSVSRGPLPGKARLRLLLRNSGIAPEINAGQRAAGLASHDGGRGNENWGRTVKKPAKKYEMQRQGKTQRHGLWFRNGGMELREHEPLAASLVCILPTLGQK